MAKLDKLKGNIADLTARLKERDKSRVDKKALVDNVSRLSDVLERDKDFDFDGLGQSLERMESSQGTAGGKAEFLISVMLGMMQELATGINGIADQMAVSNKELAKAIEDMANAKPTPQPVSKPTEWTFTVNRDSEGFIENVSVKASSKKPQTVVNSPFKGVQ